MGQRCLELVQACPNRPTVGGPPMIARPRLEFDRINAEALPHLKDIVAELTGQEGRLEGRELLIRNPHRADSAPGSFSINLDKGVWKDFASGEGGADPVSLVAFLLGNRQAEAARWLMECLGFQETAPSATPTRKPKHPAFPRVVTPVPVDAPSLPIQRNEEGRWEWRNSAGLLLKVTVRTSEPAQGKILRPFTWCELAPVRFGWKSLDLLEPRPLFGLDRLALRPDAPVLIVEGEKTALAAEVCFPDWVAVTSGSAQSAKKADWSPLADRDVAIWPDADEAGEKYALAVESSLRAIGPHSLRRVLLPEPIKAWCKPGKSQRGGWDLADPVPAGVELRALLDGAVEVDLGQRTASHSGHLDLPNRSGAYLIHEGRMSIDVPGGAPKPLCNFTARIREEVVMDDGESEEFLFLVGGRLATGESLGVARVLAESFAGMGWAMKTWGARAIINPGTSTKDQLRAAIQHLSRPIHRRTYLNTGWRRLEGIWCFLHAGGAIGPDGPVPGVELDLSARLALFNLGAPLQAEDLMRAFRSSAKLLDVGPESVTVPVWLAPFRAVVEECPFSLHISGSKGGGKTELASIAAGHFGPDLDAKQSLESWESTASAMERTLFLAKDVLGLVDDFRPGGNAKETADLMKKADRLLRGAFNRASRGRLSSDARTQRQAYVPRGLVLSTGEDLPGGESLRSRVLCLEWPAGSMCWPVLDGLQEDRANGLHAGLMAAFIQWQAQDRERSIRIRREAHKVARQKIRMAGENNRTADIAADLWSVWPVLAAFSTERGILPAFDLHALGHRLWAAVLEMTGAQTAIVKDADPAERFLAQLMDVLASGRGHLAHGEPGELPKEWESRCGWQDGQPKGPRLGYLAPRKGEVWLIGTAAYAEVVKLEPIGVSAGALWKRLNEKGCLLLERHPRLLTRRTMPGLGRSDFYVLVLSKLWGDQREAGQYEPVGQIAMVSVPSEAFATT